MSLVTVGIQPEPLFVYREYVQNAADSIAASGATKDGKIEISIDPGAMRVTIRDNGPGLSPAQALNELIPIVNSHKRRGIDRGFRGIGRLSGLAFADSVAFLTRQRINEPVTRICWDGTKLRKGVKDGLPVEKIISECVKVETMLENEYPERFFQVEIDGIARFAAGSILNREIARDYIAEVCPVPFASDFQYAGDVLNLFEEDLLPLMLDIFLNGEEAPVTRQHGNGIIFSEERRDEFREFEKFVIPTIEGNGNAAVGWVAHPSYLGALPKKPGIRCFRARIGNIQVGDETLFDHLFIEERFNRWCVAEIHILDSRIVPNSRRDYFEPGPHTRNLENYLGAVFRKMERRCRAASGERNKARRFQSFLDDAEATYKLAKSRYLTANAARMLIDKKLIDIAKLRWHLETGEGKVDDVTTLDALEKKLTRFRTPPGRVSFAGVAPSEVSVYRKLFHVLAETSASSSAATEVIEAILERVEK